jgi:hypothetical protein
VVWGSETLLEMEVDITTGILGKLRRKKGDDDDFDDEDDVQDEGSSPDSGPDNDEDGDDDDAPTGGGLFGRLKSKIKRSYSDDDDDLEAAAEAESAGPSVAKVDGTGAPNDDNGDDTDAEAVGDTSESSNGPSAGENSSASPSAVYIADGPDGQPAPGGPGGGEAAAKEPSFGSGAEDAGGTGLDLMGIFEHAEEVDEAFKDLADSVEDVAADDLANDLRELLAHLQK